MKDNEKSVLVVDLPEGVNRAETGAMRVGENDWNGIFIRGDNAAFYAQITKQAAEEIQKINQPVLANSLCMLSELLQSCAGIAVGVGNEKEEAEGCDQ